MTVHFTSDSHFSHLNVIKYCNRPFANVHEMNKALTERWNAKVKPTDTVYHLGDVVFRRSQVDLQRLNGKIVLVKGNHDKFKGSALARFESVHDLLEVKVQDPDARGGSQLIVMCHYPMLTWNKKHFGSWHLHAHSHGAIPPTPGVARLDAGVDCWDYAPFSYEELKARMREVLAA